MDWTKRDDKATRAAVIAALGVVLALVVGAAVLMQRGDTPTSVVSAAEVETTTTDLGPAFLPGESSSTAVAAPSTTSAPQTTRASTTTTAPSTTTIPPTTEVPVETLPRQETQPVAPPRDPRGFEEQVTLGEISIPKLGVTAPLLEGIRLTTLDNGPGHWPGTAMPGEVGNVVVAGHRTSHGAQFRNLDKLVVGDIVEFTTSAGVIEYKVTGTQIVTPDAVWIVNPTDTPTATLFACHPPGSVSHRIVVNLELA
jgi:sortase A